MPTAPSLKFSSLFPHPFFSKFSVRPQASYFIQAASNDKKRYSRMALWPCAQLLGCLKLAWRHSSSKSSPLSLLECNLAVLLNKEYNKYYHTTQHTASASRFRAIPYTLHIEAFLLIPLTWYDCICRNLKPRYPLLRPSSIRGFFLLWLSSQSEFWKVYEPNSPGSPTRKPQASINRQESRSHYSWVKSIEFSKHPQFQEAISLSSSSRQQNCDCPNNM
jgi:hypothetical protein